jgi:uncharacterized FlaG/YvyC family protein
MSVAPVSIVKGQEVDVVDSRGELRKPVPDSADARPTGREFAKVHAKKTLDVDASPALDKELFDKAVDQIKDFLRNNSKNELAIHIDETLNRPVIRIIDPKQGEILRIPSQNVLNVAKNIEKLRGVLFDQNA